MAIPTLLLPLDGSLEGRDRSGMFTATGSGALRFVTGYGGEPAIDSSPVPLGEGPGYGQNPDGTYYREAWALGGAVVAEEGTTNYIPNPSGWLNTTRWSGSVNGVVERDTSRALVGPASLKVIPAGDNSGAFTPHTRNDGIPAATGQSWTLSVFACGPGSYRIGIQERDSSHNLLKEHQLSNIPLSLAWKDEPDVYTIVTTEPGTAYVSARIVRHDASNDPFWIGFAQLENKPYQTTPCPQFDRGGNLLPGYSWTGTEHASPSTRDSVSVELEYPHAFGEAVVRYSEDDGETWQTEPIHEPGAFGTYGTLDLSDGVLTIGVTSHAVLIDQLIVFDRPLTEPERTLLMNADSWEWQMLYPRLGGVLRVDGGGAPFSVLRAGHGG